MTTPFQLEVRQYVKALVAGLIALLSLLAGALGDGLSTQEIIGLGVAFLTGFVGVFYAENKDPKGTNRTDLSTQAGYVSVLMVVLIVLAVLFILFYLLPALNGASL